MDTSQEMSVVDQLLSAVDEEDYSIARYTLCTALEAVDEGGTRNTKTARAPAASKPEQAMSDLS